MKILSVYAVVLSRSLHCFPIEKLYLLGESFNGFVNYGATHYVRASYKSSVESTAVLTAGLKDLLCKSVPQNVIRETRLAQSAKCLNFLADVSNVIV